MPRNLGGAAAGEGPAHEMRYGDATRQWRDVSCADLQVRSGCCLRSEGVGSWAGVEPGLAVTIHESQVTLAAGWQQIRGASSDNMVGAGWMR